MNHEPLFEVQLDGVRVGDDARLGTPEQGARDPRVHAQPHDGRASCAVVSGVADKALRPHRAVHDRAQAVRPRDRHVPGRRAAHGRLLHRQPGDRAHDAAGRDAPRRGPRRSARGRDREVLGGRGREPHRARRAAHPRWHQHRRRLPDPPLLPVAEALRVHARLGHAGVAAHRRGARGHPRRPLPESGLPVRVRRRLESAQGCPRRADRGQESGVGSSGRSGSDGCATGGHPPASPAFGVVGRRRGRGRRRARAHGGCRRRHAGTPVAAAMPWITSVAVATGSVPGDALSRRWRRRSRCRGRCRRRPTATTVRCPRRPPATAAAVAAVETPQLRRWCRRRLTVPAVTRHDRPDRHSCDHAVRATPPPSPAPATGRAAADDDQPPTDARVPGPPTRHVDGVGDRSTTMVSTGDQGRQHHARSASRAAARSGYITARRSVKRGRRQETLDRTEIERRTDHHDQVVGPGVEVRRPVVDLGDVDPDGAFDLTSACGRACAHHSSSTSFFFAKFSGGPKVFHPSAYSATSRSVTFSPLPPIRIGRRPLRRRFEPAEPVHDDRQVALQVAAAATARSRTRSRTRRSRARTNPSRCRA